MMEKKYLLVVFALLLMTVASAQQQQHTRAFDMGKFERLALGGAFKINVSQGNEFQVVATGEKEDLDDLIAEVAGGELTIKLEESKRKRKQVTLNIIMPKLTGVNLSGAATMNASGFDDVADLTLEMSGASRLLLELEERRNIDLNLSGASSLTLNGTADSVTGHLSGASRLDAEDFPSRVVDLHASGASSAVVNVTERLHVHASGTSKFRYRGGATDVQVNSSGNSSVKKSM